MTLLTYNERNYILAGNYQYLDNYIATIHREILLTEKKYDDMLERKNAEIKKLTKELEDERERNRLR